MNQWMSEWVNKSIMPSILPNMLFPSMFPKYQIIWSMKWNNVDLQIQNPQSKIQNSINASNSDPTESNG
jgi:hypothetical protein